MSISEAWGWRGKWGPGWEGSDLLWKGLLPGSLFFCLLISYSGILITWLPWDPETFHSSGLWVSSYLDHTICLLFLALADLLCLCFWPVWTWPFYILYTLFCLEMLSLGWTSWNPPGSKGHIHATRGILSLWKKFITWEPCSYYRMYWLDHGIFLSAHQLNIHFFWPQFLFLFGNFLASN